MAVQLALPRAFRAFLPQPRLPKAVPPFSNKVYWAFWAIWLAAFLLAVVGPAMGLYYRYSSPSNNSQLMLGSRAGFAVSARDATLIRFPVGSASRSLGIQSGDDIVAIYGLPLPEQVPLSEQTLEAHADDPAYIAIANLFFGTEPSEVPLTLRSPDGRTREIVVQTGEQHIEAGARELGIAPGLLNFVDLLHVITYPLLLWAAWILHRRNARDAVSSILSLAILLTMATEQPSATFFTVAEIPRWIHVGLYDVGNICLLSGILLFPHGRLSGRLMLLLGCVPVLLFLHGNVYRAVFIIFIIAAVAMLIQCLRRTPSGDLRQQIKWALYGFTSYAIFIGIAQAGDMIKMLTESFSVQLLVEMFSGLAMGLAFVCLQLGLLVALLRYRLYDAESIISRTASFAIVTVILGAGFAGVMEGIITQMQNVYSDSQTPAAVVGAIMATVLIHPLHERVQSWAERRFHRTLLELREDMPAALRELRDIADPDEIMAEVLARVNKGVLSVRSAFVMGREVKQVLGISQGEALRWLVSSGPLASEETLSCNPEDPVFPLRIRIEEGSKTIVGWLLVGPRPDGSLPGGDEREALVEIATPLANALRVAVKREQDRQELSKILDGYRLRIERIEGMLKA